MGLTVIIVLVVLAVIAVGAVLAVRGRRRKQEQQRIEAAEHRNEAEIRTASAQRREAEAAERSARADHAQAQAREQAARAEQDREVAEARHAAAERIDPDGGSRDGRSSSGGTDPASRTDELRVPEQQSSDAGHGSARHAAPTGPPVDPARQPGQGPNSGRPAGGPSHEVSGHDPAGRPGPAQHTGPTGPPAAGRNAGQQGRGGYPGRQPEQGSFDGRPGVPSDQEDTPETGLPKQRAGGHDRTERPGVRGLADRLRRRES